METMGSCLVDYEGAMKRLGGDRVLFAQLIEIYDEDTPVLLDAIRRAVASNDSQSLERAAHRLKGLVSNFGAEETTVCASELEQCGSGRRFEEARERLVDLEAELRRLDDALTKYRRR